MDTSAGWPIAVGVDGSESALDAVRWAAERAREQDGTVRLVAAVGWASSQPMGWQALTEENYRAAALAAAEEHLQAATDVAASSLPRDRIDSLGVTGLPAGVLYDESARSSLLVLGSRGRGGFRGLLLGSTTVTLAAAAHCPVVVVRAQPAPNGPVVVGVDGSPDSESALGFAFEAAARQCAPLLAVRAWADETNHPVLAMLLDETATDRLEQEALDQALEAWRQKFPGVDVRTRVVHGPAAGVLVDETSDARLAVVGSRGRGGLAGLVLGSVSQALLHHAHCPVAVVRGVDDGPVQP